MVDSIKRCEYVYSRVGGITIQCNKIIYRISEGRHYCRQHFDAVVAEAKDAVVDEAIRLVDRGRRMLGQHAKLPPAVDKLLSLGWRLGD